MLQQIKTLDQRILVIMMTAYGSIRSSVSAIKRGAFTYLTKPLDLDELQVYIRQALEFRALQDNVTFLSDELHMQDTRNELIGNSPAIQPVLQMIQRLKDVDTTVSILGEGGTGKSLVARAIHSLGGRSGGILSTLTAPPYQESNWSGNCLATKAVRSPAPPGINGESWRLPTRVPSFWTR